MTLRLRRPRDPPRNYPNNRDDFDVVDPHDNIIGRIFKPGGGQDDWMWCLYTVVRPPARGFGYCDTREEAQEVFKVAWLAAGNKSGPKL